MVGAGALIMGGLIMGNAPFPAAQRNQTAATGEPGRELPDAGQANIADPASLVAIANRFCLRGTLTPALVCYRKAILLDPNYAPAHNGLGLVLQQLGQVAAALPHHQKALALNPDMAEAHAGLGNAYRILGQQEDAIHHYRNAVAINPQYAAAHNDIAGLLQQLGHTDDAIRHYKRALSVMPDYADAHYNLANILSAHGQRQEALAHYAKAIELRPEFVEAHNNAANALHLLGRYDQAITHYTAAVRLRPDYADAWHNLGKACFALNRPEDAIAAYQQAAGIDASKPMLHNDLGAAHMVLGHLREAYAAFAAAVARDPRNATIHLNLARLAPFNKASDPRLAALEKLAEFSESLPDNDLIALNFALGKAYADLGNNERSFRHLVHANALRREQVNYDEESTLDDFARVRAVFTPKLMQKNSGGGDQSPVPVFIVGMPRSGSTLLEQILASHSHVFGAGEIDDFAAAVTEVSGASGGFPESISGLGIRELRHLGQRYVERVTAKAPRAVRITDKMLSNVSYIGLIHLALPNARIIHARRDPVDTCLSSFSIWFGDDDLPFTYDLAELGRYYRAYAELMHHWHTILPQGVMIDVWYEDVVDDLEGQARRLLAHCGLEWEDRCLDFHLTERHVRTASVAQVRRPLYRDAVGRSRVYGDLLRPLVDALESDGRSRKHSFAEGFNRLTSRQAR
jgi:tetratricopeptide (TPR) repeat protein